MRFRSWDRRKFSRLPIRLCGILWRDRMRFTKRFMMRIRRKVVRRCRIWTRIRFQKTEMGQEHGVIRKEM